MCYCVLHIENTHLHTNLLSYMQLPNKWQGTYGIHYWNPHKIIV